MREEKYDEVAEDFLDKVYGYESKLDREEWEKLVGKHCKWIFSPKEIRNKIGLPS